MTYEEELRARLDAVRVVEEEKPQNRVDLSSYEEKLLDELSEELSFGQYDLDESDLLRTLKILEMLEPYGETFKSHSALKVFYIISRIDVIQAKNLLHYCQLDVKTFKEIINSMARCKLVMKNSSNELELTLEGKSLAERMGIEIFL